VPFLLVALLAAPQLAKELQAFDPVNLPKTEAKTLRAEVERRAKSRYGSYAGDHYAELWAEVGIARKRERLAAATARQREALEAEGVPDHSPATQFVCEVYAVLEQRRLAIDRQRDELKKEYRSLVAGEPTGKHIIKKGHQARAAINTGDRVLLREYAYHLLRLRIRCVHLLELKEAPDSERYLVRQALKAKEPQLRARVAEVLSRRPKVPLGVFLGAMAREKEPGVRAVLANALGRLGDRARDAIEKITPLLEDPDERVRVALARSLARLHVPEAVEPLIARIGKEEGRERHDFARALLSLTGEKIGPDPDGWARWWQANRDVVLGEGLPPPGGGRGDLRAHRWKGEGGLYYGLPQVSKRIIYILDISDSMRFVQEGQTRLERCVTEVNRAIGALPRTATFTVLAYNSEVRPWRTELSFATPANKEAAKAFIAELRQAHTTNIYDALREAFAIAGGGASKKGTRVKADTIYLLSDGAPTLPDASYDDPERILKAVREWNALQRVTIHTIGIGKGLKFSFLLKLAEEHHGEFIRKEW
jgi:hypothetical protein